MQLKFTATFLFSLLLFTSCSVTKKTAKDDEAEKPAKHSSVSAGTKTKTFTKPVKIERSAFVSFAKTLLGTPYKYGSAVPENGLDCSGFISYVFSHFNVKTPRSSVDFTNEGKETELKNAKPGDIILFTGSDNSAGIVGHMGIITSNGNTQQFIHSASGKSVGVILSNFSGYYKTHFVKVIRVLE